MKECRRNREGIEEIEKKWKEYRRNIEDGEKKVKEERRCRRNNGGLEG